MTPTFVCRPNPRPLAFFTAFVLVMLASAARATTPACDGGILELRPGSTLDYGWTGGAHGDDPGTGTSFAFAIQRRCANDSSPCDGDEDCGGAECVRTCDCASDTSCEITGPVGGRRCLGSFAECSTNADCGFGACVSMTGPPVPQSNYGTPICTVPYFDAPLTGAIDTATGEVNLASTLRWNVRLGIAIDKPCPLCGSPDQAPTTGDTFTCDGGLNNGKPCTVDGVSDEFGGTSYDCPPDTSFGVGGFGNAVPLPELTTGTSTRTAQLPCKSFGFTGNPLNPASNPKCTDRTGPEDPICTSNADCRRCSGDPAIACDADDDCPGSGACAEAPDQPVTCGYWCHCGFCNGDPQRACFEDGDCGEGGVCQQGTGTGTQPNAPQQRHNDCSFDKFICGGEDETCATSQTGACSDQPYRSCSSNTDCEASSAGLCELAPRPCFGPRIERQGNPASLGAYCSTAGTPCSSNADCDGDACRPDTMSPDLAAVFCMPATTSSVLNSALGITGPVALEWKSSIRMCRCDVYAPECEVLCGPPDPCGDWNGDGTTTATDAQGILRVAVGLGQCAAWICDYDGSGAVTTSDALAVLRASVGQPTTPSCPSPP